MFDRVLITPLSFLVKNATVLGNSQNCSKVPTFVYLLIYILDLGIFHGLGTCILIISMVIMIVTIIVTTIILIKTKPFTGIFPRTYATNSRTAEHQSIIISLNSIF